MFTIGEAFVEDDIAIERFACDLERCKGACCTLPGGRGAPLDDNELHNLQQAVPIIRKYLSTKHLQIIDAEGVVEGEPGRFSTICVNRRECIFVLYEKDVARCSIEQAYFNGEISWRKPLSCHLFPIRISYYEGERLRYERIPECSTARENGCLKDVHLYDFVKDALIRKYGEDWYHELLNEYRHRNYIS